ncbi:WXG100 family type VII secretion target [Nocardia sp. NPDC050406]|uniref:WXG100 family type VII secretion target n=1 Tax=Nocardia sp. NPDC050406 TaxID=3364318 RepID=UPI0037A67364
MVSETGVPGGEFQVVPAEVTDAGKYVQLTAEELINGVRSLDTDVADLLTRWTGSSADHYRLGWEEARAGAVQVLAALQTMAELLGVAGTDYANMDAGNADDFCSLNLP